jgi:hypothetical protein
VANNKILENESSTLNGHAARMRYSRFKTQMDSSIGIEKKRRKNSPRKPNVEKVIKKERGLKRQKSEQTNEQEEVKSESDVRQKCEDEESIAGGSNMVKQELDDASSKFAPGRPYTPKSQYSTPSPGMGHHVYDALDGDIDDMTTSFGFTEAMGADMYGPLMGHGYDSGMGMGMSMDMAGSFEPLWHENEPRHYEEPEQSLMTEVRALVKDEPEWEGHYRR